MNSDKNGFLETADRLGARLCRDAIWAGPRCNWMGDSMEFLNGNWTVAHRSFGPELYNGTSGVALFLGRLFAATGEDRFRLSAEGAIEQALSRKSAMSAYARIGFYTGLTGMAYVLTEIGRHAEAIRILEELAADDLPAYGLDVLGGCAGAIPALLLMRQSLNRPLLLDFAVRLGERLLNTAEKSDFGWSWNTVNLPPEQPHQDLTGFSHGVAGIAWALLELFQVTGDARFRTAAEEGFRYERHWFDAERENWPDFRSLYDPTAVSKTPGFPLAWCHGAPGIGLSRLRAYQITGDEIFRGEAEAAIRTTAKSLDYEGGSFALCHGTAGNAELLLYAAEVLGNSEYEAVAAKTGRDGIDKYEKQRNPWPCGVTGGGETPDLMLGLAGVGYFYLRLYDAEKIPPIVILAR